MISSLFALAFCPKDLAVFWSSLRLSDRSAPGESKAFSGVVKVVFIVKSAPERRRVVVSQVRSLAERHAQKCTWGRIEMIS